VVGSILVSAGEASGDLYAAMLVEELRRMWPQARYFGVAGPRLAAAGVEPVVDARDLAVVGLVEVLAHIPRIYRRYRTLLAAARERRPRLAILTDAPDFHLPLARRLARQGVPVVQLVAPQVWAWRRGRIKRMRRDLRGLLCIFPFEEQFFADQGLKATYIGHPLSRVVAPETSRAEFFRKHRLPLERPMVAVLPGSRRMEAARHLPVLVDAVERMYREQAASFVLAAAPATGAEFLRQRIGGAPIQVVEGETWDAIAHADLALAASGTVTVEAALLGTPMVAFYKVAPLSWLAGKFLVRVPFYSMVNVIAGRPLIPELMQSEMTGPRLAAEALRLLRDPEARGRMKEGLSEVRRRLSGKQEPMRAAAEAVRELMEGQKAHVA